MGMVMKTIISELICGWRLSGSEQKLVQTLWNQNCFDNNYYTIIYAFFTAVFFKQICNIYKKVWTVVLIFSLRWGAHTDYFQTSL